MSKNNIGLVEYCKAQLGRPYWYGTYGEIANAKLWAERSKMYGRYYSDKRKAVMKDRGDEGKKVHDCGGLIKGYVMSKGVDMPAEYDKRYDLSADAMFNKAKVKGSINTLPKDRIGLGLHKSGHVGVYIGNGREIEARGFDYGVLEDDVANTGFTEWFEIPFIDYEDTAPAEQPAEPTEATKSIEDIANEVRAGKWGNDPERTQRLTAAGYDAKAVQAKVNEQLGIGKPAVGGTFKGLIVTQKDNLRVRSGAGLNYEVVKYLTKGQTYEFDGESNSWYHLADGSGYASSSYIKKI